MSTLGKKLPARASDLTGKRFGQLVVIERAGSSLAGSATWTCICDCGRLTRSSGTDLRRGRTCSCGCGSQEATRSRHALTRSLVGKRFGRLVVIAFAGLDSYPRATWMCRCDCGVTRVIRGSHLTAGETVSCGCYGREAVSRSRKADLHEVVGYTAAHGRVKVLHGLAGIHLCVDCFGSAMDWSYDHEDPNELVDARGRPYSMNPSHYWPRCRSCHTNFDSAVKGTASADAGEGATA